MERYGGAETSTAECINKTNLLIEWAIGILDYKNKDFTVLRHYVTKTCWGVVVNLQAFLPRNT